MAKKGSIQRNDKRKRAVARFKSKREQLKAEIYNKDIPLEERFALVLKLAKLPRNSAENRIRNRCSLTGRPRGFHRRMGISRNMLRALAAQGQLPGVVKASW